MGKQQPQPRQGLYLPNGNASNQQQQAMETASNGQANEQQQLGEWPIAMQKWVQQVFSGATQAEDKDKLQEWLKAKLSYVVQRGLKDEIDWANEPLPLVRGNEVVVPDQTPNRKGRKSRWDAGNNQNNNASNNQQQPKGGTPGRFQRNRGRGGRYFMQSQRRSPLPPRRRSRSRSRSSSHSRGSSRSPSPRSRRSSPLRRDRHRKKKRLSRYLLLI